MTFKEVIFSYGELVKDVFALLLMLNKIFIDYFFLFGFTGPIWCFNGFILNTRSLSFISEV